MSKMRWALMIAASFIFFDIATAQRGHGNGGWNSEDSYPKGTITGAIADDDSDAPLEYATITVYKSQDSTLVTGGIANTRGKFELEVPYGHYYAVIDFISYHAIKIRNIKIGTEGSSPVVDLKKISLSVSSEILSEVEVSAEKSQVQIGLDKKVFNVDKDLSNIGGTVQDVLGNVPSVQVDMDGNVSLRGSANVRILIDGKPSGLTGISTSDVLSQLPANSVESIEVITNPSVKYDAEGMAGIINIVLKKNKQKGFNGLLSLTGGYPHDHTASANINYAVKKLNFFGTYSAKYSEKPGFVLNNRETTLNDTTAFSNQNGIFQRNGMSLTMRTGAEYMPDKKNKVSASVMYKPSFQTNKRKTEYESYDYNKVLTDLSVRNTTETNPENNTDLSLDYEKNFDKKGKMLTAGARYSNGSEIENMDISQEYASDYNSSGSSNLAQKSATKENQITGLLQLDYKLPFGAEGIIETGYKSAFRKIDKVYEIEEYDKTGAIWNYLADISNHFIYDEHIHAGYFMYIGNKEKTSFQAGVRAEQSEVISLMEESDEKTSRSYLSFFPSAHIARQIGKNRKLQISYSRRINRPSFWMLNPFFGYADPFNLWRGNPNLNPEFTHSFEITFLEYGEKSNMSAGIYYKHTDGVIQRIRKIDSLGFSVTQPENLSGQDAFGAEATYSVTLLDWWKINGSMNFFRNIVDGGNIGAIYASDYYSWSGRFNSQTNILKELSVNFMFNYNAPEKTVQGTRQAMYFMDVAMKKTILDKKGTINIRLSDVMNSRKYSMDSYGENFFVHSEFKRGGRTVFVEFTYKLNSYKPKRNAQQYEYDMDDGGM